jgi:hypothetical protein
MERFGSHTFPLPLSRNDAVGILVNGPGDHSPGYSGERTRPEGAGESYEIECFFRPFSTGPSLRHSFATHLCHFSSSIVTLVLPFQTMKSKANRKIFQLAEE